MIVSLARGLATANRPERPTVIGFLLGGYFEKFPPSPTRLLENFLLQKAEGLITGAHFVGNQPSDAPSRQAPGRQTSRNWCRIEEPNSTQQMPMPGLIPTPFPNPAFQN
jgi:hypothetical protein